MKFIVKCACLFFLAVGAGSNVLLAQTTPDTNKPAAVAPRLVKRFTGKIATLDTQAKSFTVDSATNDVVKISETTRIIKDRKPATFDDLAAGQTVTGAKHQDATGAWVATTVSVAVPKPPTTDPKVQ